MGTLDPHARRRARRSRLAHALHATALTTSIAVTATLLATAPAHADEPGDFPDDPYQRTLRISLGQQQREDRCDLSRDVRVAGPVQKTFVNDILAGPDAKIRETLYNGGSGYPSAEYLNAGWSDKDAESAWGKEFQDRQDRLDKTNSPYAYVNSQGGRPYFAPVFGADILTFTWNGHAGIRTSVPQDLTPKPSAASVTKAKEVYSAIAAGNDDWTKQYTRLAAQEIGVAADSREIGSANDIASFLRFGGFPTRPRNRTRWSSAPRSKHSRPPGPPATAGTPSTSTAS
ncbi:hypothetical protein ACWEGQ_22885 [Streptomyces seoulensis]